MTGCEATAAEVMAEEVDAVVLVAATEVAGTELKEMTRLDAAELGATVAAEADAWLAAGTAELAAKAEVDG